MKKFVTRNIIKNAIIPNSLFKMVLSARMRRKRGWIITLYVEYFLFMCVKLKNMLKQGWERSQFSPLGLEAVYFRGWGGQGLFEKTMHIIKMRERESKHRLKSICLISIGECWTSVFVRYLLIKWLTCQMLYYNWWHTKDDCI